MSIKPIPKPRKTKNKTVKYWSQKADAALQNIGRLVYEDTGCILGCGTYSCLHHVVLKSRSTFLRYKWRNVVAICPKCHMIVHSTDVTEAKRILDRIIEIKGQDWYDGLMTEKHANRGMKAGYTYYRDMFYRLEKITPMKLYELE